MAGLGVPQMSHAIGYVSIPKMLMPCSIGVNCYQILYICLLTCHWSGVPLDARYPYKIVLDISPTFISSRNHISYVNRYIDRNSDLWPNIAIFHMIYLAHEPCPLSRRILLFLWTSFDMFVYNSFSRRLVILKFSRSSSICSHMKILLMLYFSFLWHAFVLLMQCLVSEMFLFVLELWKRRILSFLW
jgi:hypothetical protein